MRLIVIVSALALCFAGAVYGEDIKVANDGDPAGLRVDCDVTGCDFYGMTVGQTLVTDQLHTFGPLLTTAGGSITDVVVELDITQTWVGDLFAELWYDADNNGVADFGPVYILCRPNLAACPFPDGCCGCSGNVAGVYTFGDAAIEALGDPNCPTDILPGCFLPAPETPSGFAAAFGGAPTGGSFYLDIGDAAAGDDTFLAAWGVYVCGGTTGTEHSTWGAVKAMYR